MIEEHLGISSVLALIALLGGGLAFREQRKDYPEGRTREAYMKGVYWGVAFFVYIQYACKVLYHLALRY